MDEPHSHYLADICLRHVQDVADRLDKAFSGQYKDVVKAVRDNITVMKKSYTTRYR